MDQRIPKPDWKMILRHYEVSPHTLEKIEGAFDDWFVKTFKDAKVCYGQLSEAGRPYDLGFVKTDSDTHEFLVIARPIEKPKPKTDRELLEAIVDVWDPLCIPIAANHPLFKSIEQAREAIKGRDE